MCTTTRARSMRIEVQELSKRTKCCRLTSIPAKARVRLQDWQMNTTKLLQSLTFIIALIQSTWTQSTKLILSGMKRMQTRTIMMSFWRINWVGLGMVKLMFWLTNSDLMKHRTTNAKGSKTFTKSDPNAAQAKSLRLNFLRNIWLSMISSKICTNLQLWFTKEAQLLDRPHQVDADKFPTKWLCLQKWSEKATRLLNNCTLMKFLQQLMKLLL